MMKGPGWNLLGVMYLNGVVCRELMASWLFHELLVIFPLKAMALYLHQS
ncbi:hypothetical protein CsSME_00047069 [Camellia sinensis var. sinensis]